MLGLQNFLAGAMGLIVFAVAIPRALASARNSGRRNGAAFSTRTISQKAVNLSPIVVHGHKLYWPVVLQIIKNGLNRSFTNRPQDADKLVCQFEAHRNALDGTVLFCETNRRAWQYERALRSKRDAAMGGGSGSLPVSAGFEILHRRINRGDLLKLLKKLPPANASYTLRVTNHGKLVAKYVFSHGNLVSIFEAGPGR